MKRRYKLLLIIVLGGLLAIFINNIRPKGKITLVAIGDSLSVALTPYGILGTSFTDYVKEYLESKSKLGMYNYDYSYDHLKIKEINEYMNSNKIKNKIPIKQIIKKSGIVTIAIGIDELADKSLRKEIDNDDISEFIDEYEILLKTMREFYHKRIVVVGLYPVINISKNTIIDINKKLSILCGKYNTDFIDIMPYSLDKTYYFKNDNYYLNYKVHKKISEIIINKCLS